MEVGSARLGTGMAGALAAAIKQQDPSYQVGLNQAWKFPDALAKAIVTYIQDNAEVVNGRVT